MIQQADRYFGERQLTGFLGQRDALRKCPAAPKNITSSLTFLREPPLFFTSEILFSFASYIALRPSDEDARNEHQRSAKSYLQWVSASSKTPVIGERLGKAHADTGSQGCSHAECSMNKPHHVPRTPAYANSG